jgi:hypothetical protein
MLSPSVTVTGYCSKDRELLFVIRMIRKRINILHGKHAEFSMQNKRNIHLTTIFRKEKCKDNSNILLKITI